MKEEYIQQYEFSTPSLMPPPVWWKETGGKRPFRPAPDTCRQFLTHDFTVDGVSEELLAAGHHGARQAQRGRRLVEQLKRPARRHTNWQEPRLL